MAKALHAFPSLNYSSGFGFSIPEYMISDGNSNACSVSDYDPSDEDRLQVKSLEPVEGTSLIATSRMNSVAKQEAEMDTSFQFSILRPAAPYTIGPDSLNFSIDGASFVSSSTFHAAHSAIEGNQLVRESNFMIPMLNTLSRTKETDLKSQQHLGTSSRWGTSTFRSSSTRCTQEKALGVQHKWTGKRALAQRESHIWSERERRKGMNRLFCILRSLLPEPISKTDKSTVVSEIIKHISILRKDIEELSSKQASLLNRASKTSQSSSVDSGASTIIRGDTPSSRTMQSSTSIVAPAVALHISNNIVFLNISCTRRPSLFANILRVMRQHQLTILNATVSTEDTNISYCIHSKAMDITHFARESLHSALLAITKASTLNGYQPIT